MASRRTKLMETGGADGNRKSGPGISKGLTADTVLEAAEIVIARQGLAEFRVRDVAEALGVQSQAIYNYFDGREGLLQAVSEKFTRDVVDAATVSGAADPWDEVKLSAKNVARYLCSKPSAAYLVVADMAQWTLSQTGKAREIDVGYQRHIASVLAEGAAAGLFRPMRTATYLSFVTIGIAANVLWNDRHKNLDDGTAVSEEIIEQEAVDLVVALLTPRG
jgi:AcrR family transcriptional regulator